MAKLIYCAYSILDQTAEPEWVENLQQHPLVRHDGWGLYRPALGFVENWSRIEVGSALIRPVRCELGAAERAALKLDPDLFKPMGDVRSRLERGDSDPTSDVVFKRTYAILRSDVMLVDLDKPDHGMRSQEALLGYLCGVPVVGIAHRFILSPSVTDKVPVVIFPKNIDEIVRQILAHDHKLTAVLTQCGGRAAPAVVEKPDGSDASADTV